MNPSNPMNTSTLLCRSINRDNIARTKTFGDAVKAIAGLVISSLLLASETFHGSPFIPKLIRCEFSQIMMGTKFTIIVYAKDVRAAAVASTAAFNCVERLDAIMSDYRDTSELMRLCRKSGGGPDIFSINNDGELCAHHYLREFAAD
jgi:hypothetical protein